MTTVYIIGPLTTHGDTGENIFYATKLAAVLMAQGYAPIFTHAIAGVPWSGEVISQGIAMAACRELVRRADMIALIEGWEKSTGSTMEWEEFWRAHPEGALRYACPPPAAGQYPARDWSRAAIDAEWTRLISLSGAR